MVRACKIVNLERSMFYYSHRKDDSEVENKLVEYAQKLPNRGCPEYYKRIRREGIIWNHKRVERVYKKLRMNRKKKIKRRIPNPKKEPLLQPLQSNEVWSMDFMHDTLESGRKFRTLNIIDDFNREALAIEVAYSFPSVKVVSIVKDLIDYRGKPKRIRTDNGTEFIADAFKQFCNDNEIERINIQKGKPTQNAFIERFNRSYREGVLDAIIFEELHQVKQESEIWKEDYNHHHPHKSLANHTPIEFKNKYPDVQANACQPSKPEHRDTNTLTKKEITNLDL